MELKKQERLINGSIDSVLRGAGVWGAAVATLKNMAIIYMSNGEEDLSIETYEKALIENPKQPSCLKNIGLIYEKRGRYAEQNGDLDQRDIWFDKAAEVWSKAVRLYPGGYLDIENWLKNSGRSSIDMYL